MLELACGTGIWTERLARHATRLTAVDASPEVLALNRDRLAAFPVNYVEADIFAWRPPRLYDAVFFSFWLTHVPPSRWAPFWASVATALKPGGRAIFVDNLWRPGDWPAERPTSFEQERSDLSDGRTFRIVKRYYEPAELVDELSRLGWTADVTGTARFFIKGWATLTR